MSVTEHSPKVALTIAGSDPSGGAGIQADIKTFTAIGVYCGAVISSLTAQNTQAVFGVQPVDPGFVKDQIDSVLSDLNVSHIKIGMLGSAAVATSICDALADFNGEIIYDPVLKSSSGQQLINERGYASFRESLFGICTILTPNIPELSLLSEHEFSTKEELFEAAEKLLQQYQNLRAVIITGAHFKPERGFITDYLLSSSAASPSAYCQEISHPWISSCNTHGTGCTFSAAFTAYHLLTGDDSESFQKAVRYMDDIIKKSAQFKIGHGTGPLMHYLK
jgi:hydroxymethylpyrimidine/phosphomethylpyrimidine kinase